MEGLLRLLTMTDRLLMHSAALGAHLEGLKRPPGTFQLLLLLHPQQLAIIVAPQQLATDYSRLLLTGAC